jgi:hypothetical protein
MEDHVGDIGVVAGGGIGRATTELDLDSDMTPVIL